MIFQIDIPKRASCCFKGGEPLTHGSEYCSALIKNEDESYQRQDYCLTCWKEIQNHLASHSWKSAVPLKKEASELPKHRDDRAFYLLKEALSSPHHDQNIAEAFILALYLARRRLIYLRQEIHQEGKLPVNVYEVAETEEMLCVPKISISALEVEKIQVALAKKMSVK